MRSDEEHLQINAARLIALNASIATAHNTGHNKQTTVALLDLFLEYGNLKQEN